MVEGRRTRDQALARYAAFSDSHARPFRMLKRSQDLVGPIVARERLLALVVRGLCNRRILDWFFHRYMAVAPPEFALATAAHPRAERIAALA